MIKQIIFTNSRNETISGVLKQKDRSAPLIIVCHGYKSSNNHPAIESITEKLYAMGNTTFAFNFSEGAQGFNLQEQVADINDSIAFFKEYKKIIVLAGSFGSLDGVIAATKSKKITGLVTVNGFFGTGQLGGEILARYLLFRILALFNTHSKKNWHFFKKNYLPEKLTCNTLIIHALHDNEVFISQSEDFFEKVGGKKAVHVLEKGDHHLTRESYRQEVATTVNEWLKSAF